MLLAEMLNIMIIKKIFINAFGKLENYSLDLQPGMQVLCAENEFGKSTLIQFIKIMFFSRCVGEKASIKDKELRKKYAPWSGLPMGGSIEFIYHDHLYKLQKDIHFESPSKDVTVLKNLTLGSTINLGKKEEVGEYLFGIDVKSFEKSSYISTTGKIDFEITSTAKDTLSEKILASVSDLYEENGSKDLAIKRINEAIKDLKPSRGTGGKIFAAQLQINELNTAIHKAQSLEENNAKLTGELEKIKLLRQEQRDLTTKLESHENFLKITNIKRILEMATKKDGIIAKIGLPENTIHSLSNTLNNHIEKININISKSDELKNILDLNKNNSSPISSAEFENLNLKIKSKESYEKILKKIEDILNTYNSHNEKYENRLFKLRKNQKNFLFMGVSCSLIAFVLGLALKAPLLGFGVSTALILAFAYFFFKYKNYSNSLKTKKMQNDVQYQENLIQILKESQHYENFENKFSCENLDAKSALELALHTFEKAFLNEQEEISQMLKSKNCSSVQSYCENYAKSSSFNQIKQSYEKQIECTEKLKSELINYVSQYTPTSNFKKATSFTENLILSSKNIKELENKISYELNFLGFSLEDIPNLSNYVNQFKDKKDINIITKQEAHALKERLAELSRLDLENKYIQIKQSIKSPNENISDLSKKLETRKLNLENMQMHLESLQVALNTLNETSEELRKYFNPKLNSRASEIFTQLTNNKYSSINIDKNYSISINSNFKDYKCENFSNGTIDQAYLALRIAIAELISNKSHIPIILDDAFMQYDDSRLEAAFRFLKNYSNNTQIIVFTCHTHVEQCAKQNGALKIN